MKSTHSTLFKHICVLRYHTESMSLPEPEDGYPSYPPPSRQYERHPGLVKVDVQNGMLSALENEPLDSDLRSRMQVYTLDDSDHWVSVKCSEDWKILFQIIRGGPKLKDLGVLGHFMDKYPHRFQERDNNLFHDICFQLRRYIKTIEFEKQVHARR